VIASGPTRYNSETFKPPQAIPVFASNDRTHEAEQQKMSYLFCAKLFTFAVEILVTGVLKVISNGKAIMIWNKSTASPLKLHTLPYMRICYC